MRPHHLVLSAALASIAVAGCGDDDLPRPVDAQSPDAPAVVDAALGDAAIDAADSTPDDAAPADATDDAAISTPDAALPDDAAPDAGVDLPGPPPTGACRSGWCWVYPLPQGNSLTDVWGSSPDDVWAIGDYGVILHYLNGSWTTYAGGTLSWGDGTQRLWGTDDDDVWASTGGGVFHWDGAAWTKVLSASGGAIGGTGPDDVWVQDGAGAWVWNGTGWTGYAMPTPSWQPVAFGGSPGNVWTVSTQGGVARWLGSSWVIVDPGSHPTNAAVILDEDHIVTAGNSGVAFWNGATWTSHPPPISAGWDAIAATSFDDVWIAGVSSSGFHRYHWNGSTWSEATDGGDTSWAQALWIDSTGAVWAASLNAQVETWNGASWIERTIGDAYVTAVWGSSDTDIWTISRMASPLRWRAMHWDGLTWSEATDFSFGAGWQMTRMWGNAPDNIWIAAGHQSSAGVDRHMIHWDGVTWTAMGPFGHEDSEGLGWRGFESVWGSASNDVWAVAWTKVYHYNGTAWNPVGGVTGGTDILGTASNNVYVLDGTNLRRWNGATWSVAFAPYETLIGWLNSPTDIWLKGYPVSLHYDGTSFTPYYGGIPIGTEMFTVGDGLLRWDGGFGGTVVALDYYFDTAMAWRSPSGKLYSAGRGLLVH
jgi:hypothetical protein